MSRCSTRLPILVALTLTSLGCGEAPRAIVPQASASPAPQASASPAVVRYVVHVDTLDPAMVAQFEQARIRFVKALERRNKTDYRGLYLRIGESTYWSVVPFFSWSDLDVLGTRRKLAQQQMQGVVEEYDRLSDEGLIFPHKNEIWTERLDLSYLPAGLGLRDAVRVEIEDVRPMADYAAAWAPVSEALAKGRYPVERRTFTSSYGSGRTLSFWLERGDQATQTPSIEDALIAEVGEARAKELLAGVRACSVGSETLSVRVRLDMAAPGAAYMP